MPLPLLTMLKLMQKEGKPRATDHILLNYWGKPWSSAQALSHAIRDHLISIGAPSAAPRPGPCMACVRTPHRRLKGTAGIKSVTGHVSNEMTEFRAKHANEIAMSREVVEAGD